MKRISLLLAFALSVLIGVYSLAKAAAPKRLLLVTTTMGFRHAAVPIQEQVIRELAKSSGDFTIVSTSDSPDFPTDAYQAGVDQRNARVSVSKAYPNDVPAIAGGFDGPRGTIEQVAALANMNTSLAPLAAAVTSATAALNSVIFSDNPNAADIKSKVDAETAAVLALANARLQAVNKIQASPAKLNADQMQALAAAGGGGRGGPGRGGAGSEAPKPLTGSQQAAVSTMNSSLTALNQAVTGARAALDRAAWGDGMSAADLNAKADAFRAAGLALAGAKAEAFAKIQASPDKLDPAQFQLASQGGGRGGNGGRGGPGGRGADPTTAAVTKVLQQYLNPDALKNYDAVAFLSTTGELPIPDMAGFLKWIYDGHALIGIHSAADTLHQTPEYLKMLGGEFSSHGAFHPSAPVVNMDPRSPITAGWGSAIPINEEFYLFKNYDPKQVHVLLEMKQQPYTREAGEYPVSWIKMYGKGRVFYTSLGHRDDVLLPDATIGDQEYKVRFNQNNVPAAVQKHFLQGIRWALGLVEADVTPQAH